MFSIGEFARHGRVSVRMLRHYDTIGLLQPACVDPVTGYRFYRAGQLADLNRVIALKELGFSLQQVQSVLGDQLSAAELRGMLRLRRAEIRAQIDAETTRLARVEARLMTIEDEARTPVDGVIVKSLPQVRVAELAGTAAGYEPDAITPVIQPLYCDLWGLMAAAGVSAAGPAVAYYQDAPDGDGAVVVHAAVPVVTEADADHGFSVTSLPQIDHAAVIIHHGRMDDVLVTGQALARWTDANGYRSAGYAREVTLEWSADPGTWVTELQQPIITTGG
ncbi:MAG TPA: MerR family transcriptional regulator [Streptosporangiaceae bacterium]|jgi:DNA-binding transcriptional MerR regulator/predicted transcriptional regulator YdeE